MEEMNEEIQEFSIEQIPEEQDIKDIIMNLMVNPNLAPINYFNDFSEEPINPKNIEDDEAAETGVFCLEGGQWMSMTTHAFHHHVSSDPKTATEIIISRAVRKMVASGAKPEVISAFLYHIDIADPNGQVIASGAKKGLENACKKFGVQQSDRKIRFDYYSGHESIVPTIIVSIMGSITDKSKLVTHTFKTKGNNIFVIGRSYDDINSSEYLEFYHGIYDSPLPVFDIDQEVKLQNVLTGLIERELVASASPVGKGGLFFSLLRAGMPVGLGFDITTDAEIRRDAFLFGESMGRMIVGVNPSKEDDFVDFMQAQKIPFFAVGHVTKGEIRIDDESFGFIDKMAVGPEF